MSKVGTMPQKEELTVPFLIHKSYMPCDAEFCATCDGSAAVFTKPQVLRTSTLRPLCAVGEISRNSAFFVYRQGIKPYVEYSTLFQVCLHIFERSCNKPNRRFRESQVLTAVGHLLLRIAFSDIDITCQGVSQFLGLSDRLRWESMYTTIEAALHVLHDGDNIDDWYNNLSMCNQPI